MHWQGRIRSDWREFRVGGPTPSQDHPARPSPPEAESTTAPAGSAAVTWRLLPGATASLSVTVAARSESESVMGFARKWHWQSESGVAGLQVCGLD